MPNDTGETSESFDIKELIRKRGYAKRSLTTFTNYLDSLPNSITPTIVFNLEDRISKLTLVYEDYQLIQSQLLSCKLTKEQEEEVHAESELFANSYFDAVATSRYIISQFRRAENISQYGAQPPQPAASPSVDASISSVSVSLPKIELPKFSGNLESWLSFRDTYLSLIHTNASLSDIQKHHYLRSSLTAEAALVIGGVELTAEGYLRAWTLLTERYENKKALLDHHLRSLFNITAVNRECAKSLRTLVDSVSTHIAAARALQQPVQHWDALVIHLVYSKLDLATSREWEQSQRENLIEPSLSDLLKFLRQRADVIERLDRKRSDRYVTKPSADDRKHETKQRVRSLSATANNCAICNQQHFTSRCPQLLTLRPSERAQKLATHKLCFNCLRPGHTSEACRSSNCRQCGKRHHTLIHDAQSKFFSRSGTSSDAPGAGPALTDVSTNSSTLANNVVLLPTAMVYVVDSKNRLHSTRALLDSGSQPNLITQRLANTLKLTVYASNVDLSGISSSSSPVIGQCDVLVRSRTSSFSANIPCLVLSNITSYRPSVKIARNTLTLPHSSTLADPQFDSDRTIDLLIGASYFMQLIANREINVGPCMPNLRSSKFGWLISGAVSNTRARDNDATTLACSLDNQLRKFWEIENLTSSRPLTPEEKYCEEHFQSTIMRNSSGRFVATIPLSRDPNELGESYDIACNRFLALESKLYKQPRLRSEYTSFMREYIELGHMTLITNKHKHELRDYYIPHHGVHNKAKLRVVFDASAKSSNGISLNDIQHVGPKLQNDLIDILIRFRKYKFAVSADIQMMYRQIEINEKQRSLQRVIWRESRDEPLGIYTLNTVTYGTASAPFIAIRCLRQLADTITDHLEAKRAILEDFYVDDLLTGGDTREEITNKCQQITHTLDSAGMRLHKWISSDSNLLHNLSVNTTNTNETLSRSFSDGDPAKILGLIWSSDTDLLSFQSISKAQLPKNAQLTKRKVLSLIATLFDPLGLIGPCIVLAKIFMQTLWAQKIDWDEPLNQFLYDEFANIWKEMHFISHVSVPRGIITNHNTVHLHGFADASEKAYGGCIYIYNAESSQAHLLIAKSKVAPLSTLTIPRLELCAALLLARLVAKATNALQISIQSITLWTDSTVVLGWLRKSPSELKTFVAHRVSEIQALDYQWRHVPSHLNPADSLSRGLSPKLLATDARWWHGPPFIRQPLSSWPENITNWGDIPELKSATACSMVALTSNELIDFNKYSSLSGLERIFAYVRRFIQKARKLHVAAETGILKLSEIKSGLHYLVKLSQCQSFKTEINELKKDKNNVPQKLRRLNPFLDDEGILRVGGRLANSNLSYDHIHPMLIDGGHPLAKLIMQQMHVTLLHIGIQGLLYATRQKFWITSGRKLARQIVFQCVPCFRAHPAAPVPMMGQLPRPRITQQFAFAHTGVDFAGPITLKTTNNRGSKQYKAYLAVFVCFAVKAVHLDVVTSLSAEAFLATLRRFVARRGKPTALYSDNGTNFIGANSELRKLYKYIANEKDELCNAALKCEVAWNFIPPRAPHFGGLWEAAVKSVKHHLHRVIKDRVLTFEDLSTLLYQIEGILNSRPLSALSVDPNDLNPLTPAHFLIGRPMTSLPDPSLDHIKEARMSKFQRLQHTVQHFWRRWKNEYLHQLQHRPKWHKNAHNPDVGQLCVLLEDNSHPTSWRMARICKVHPGKDGQIRVVTVKTASGEAKRPLTKIAILPIT